MASKQSLRRKDAKIRDTLEYRAFSIRASTVNEEGRTVDATISTEAPVPMPDYVRGEMVPEVLLASGVELPSSRQVPLLDSHARESMNDQLGSARGIRIEGGEVVGTLNFASGSDRQWQMVREGHATDVSAGYQVLKRVYVPRGETRTVSGQSFTGPVNVATQWRLREVSLTPIGADEQAKLRGLDATAVTDSEDFTMKPELRKVLIGRGMPETLSDDEAQTWAINNISSTPVDGAEHANGRADVGKTNQSGTEAFDAERAAALFAKEADRIIREREEKRAAYFAEVDSLCELADLPDEKEAVRGLADVAAAKKYLAELKVRNTQNGITPAPRITVTGDGQQRFVSDVSTALTLRAFRVVCEKEKTAEAVFPTEKRSKNWQRWENAGLFDIARECLQVEGYDLRGATTDQIAITALFGPRPELGGLDRRASVTGYHVTGNFLKITQDAINKSMQVGYTEAPSTWEGPMRRGDSVSDFKTVHRMRIGAIPNLPVWNDNRDPERVSLQDSEETYAVESRSAEISLSYRLLVNDDMSVLSRIPAQMGAAARRTVNAFAWSLITSNPTMGDGVALFSAATGARKRQNLTTGSATPTTTTIGAMTKLMRLMRGENTPEANEGDDVLNLQPRYIVGPAALELLISQVVNSAYDPNSTAGLANYNPNRVLIPVIEPLLDATSATAWYLFASPMQIDTAEVAFLRGQETPQVRMLTDERNLSQAWIVLQTFGGKALNHRGIQRHDGA